MDSQTTMTDTADKHNNGDGSIPSVSCRLSKGPLKFTSVWSPSHSHPFTRYLIHFRQGKQSFTNVQGCWILTFPEVSSAYKRVKSMLKNCSSSNPFSMSWALDEETVLLTFYLSAAHPHEGLLPSSPTPLPLGPVLSGFPEL